MKPFASSRLNSSEIHRLDILHIRARVAIEGQHSPVFSSAKSASASKTSLSEVFDGSGDFQTLFVHLIAMTYACLNEKGGSVVSMRDPHTEPPFR